MTTTLPGPAVAGSRLAAAVRYLMWGGVAGLIVAILGTAVMALFYGQAQGMSPGNCVVYSCTLTLLLSQVVGISGMLVGVGAGALAGGFVYLAKYRSRAGWN